MRLSVPQGNTGPVKVELLYDGPLEAPIAKGEEVARLKLTAPGLEPSTVPLVAGEAVERAGPLRRIVNGFTAFLR